MKQKIEVKGMWRYIMKRRCGGSRYGCFALIFSSTLSLTAFILALHLFALVGDDLSLHHPISPLQTMLIDEMVKESKGIDEKVNDGNMVIMNESKGQVSSEEALCIDKKAKFDYCDIQGDVRVDPNSSTIFVVRPPSPSPSPSHSSPVSATNETSSWIIEPYPRKGTGHVTKWTVKIAAADDTSVPKCAQTHSPPAVLFSINGFTGNHFHDFADVLLPLFITSYRFNTEVQFLAADYERKWWWPEKYRPLLNRLSRHVIVDIHSQNFTHCYNHLIAGLQLHGRLTVDPSSGVRMDQFRRLLRRTYSLDRETAGSPRPRLMIASRSKTRVLTNEDEISAAAREVGFEVVAAEGRPSGNLTEFAQLVNSCDVMVGVFGAGLTNMVFLPEKAVLIQILPLGGINRLIEHGYGSYSGGMNLRYLEYEIGVNESSLIRRYPIHHPIVRDPTLINGWPNIFEVYLNNQNITIDVRRFRPTLAEALHLVLRS